MAGLTQAVIAIIALVFLVVTVIAGGHKQQQKFFNVTSEAVHASSLKRSSGDVFSEPALIPLGDQQLAAGSTLFINNAYQFVFQKLQPQQTEFILYPYPFTHNVNNNSQTVALPFNDGALLSVNPSDLPNNQAANFFQYYNIVDNITLSDGKALYDTSIGILRVLGTVSGQSAELTYDSYTYCQALQSNLGKWSQCYTNYAAYYAATSGSTSSTSIAYLAGSDIANNTAVLNPLIFGILIIPDIVPGTISQVLSALGTAGQNNIANFINNGGTVVAFGQGGYLLEAISVLTTGTFDTTTTLRSKHFYVDIVGCSQTAITASTNALTPDEVFSARTLCFSVPYADSGATTIPIYTPYNIKNPNGLIPVAFFNPAKGNLLTSTNGVAVAVGTSTNPNQYPAILFKPISKGRVIIHLGAPALQSGQTTDDCGYYAYLYNSIFLGQSKPFILDYSIPIGVIPAEEQVYVNINTNLLNLFQDTLTSFTVSFWTQVGIVITSSPSQCVLTNTTAPSVNPSNLDYTQYVVCTPSGGFAGLSSLTYTFVVYINNVLVTQSASNVLLLEPVVSYTQVNGFTQVLHLTPITANALQAASLRVDANPEPSSIYPLPGQGSPIEDIINVINTANSIATNVNYISVMPLIAPMVDANNQGALGRLSNFDYLYYTSNVNYIADYQYTFTAAGQDDYIDYQLLSQRGAFLAANFDAPIKSFKIMRSTAAGSTPRFPVLNVDFGADGIANITNAQYNTNVDSSEFAIQQDYFDFANQFFEAAGPRMMSFVDTTTATGASSLYATNPPLYAGGFPPNMENPRLPGTAKQQPVFVRTDLHFFTSFPYAQPNGVAREWVITLDRYNESNVDYTGTSYPCGIFDSGTAPSFTVVNGYYDSSQPFGWKAPEYNNQLRNSCDKIVVPFNQIEAWSGGFATPAHWLMPIIDPNVLSASDYYGFDNTTGLYQDYPELAFVFAFTASFAGYANISYRGGRYDFYLPSTFSFDNTVADPVAQGYITFQADHIAFDSTSYNDATKVISTYFKRGQLPDESNGVPDNLAINLEHTTATGPFNVTLSAYEMSYDFSQVNSVPNKYERYDFRQNYTLTLLNRPFLSFPAVKFNFVLNRTGLVDTGVPGSNSNTDPSYVLPSENLTPFTSVGVYIQELTAHRTVWDSLQIQPETDPGIVTINPTSVPTHLGVSSIPFREFLTIGSGQMIPSLPETTRVVWNDYWGRVWEAPVRSLFLDVVPLPSPLRNFELTTTFELLNSTGGRELEWRVDDDLQVRIQLKVINNYLKYFSITGCRENQVLQYPFGALSTVYGNNNYIQPGGSSSNVWSSSGHLAFYGHCFDNSQGVINPNTAALGGAQLTSTQQYDISQAQLCTNQQFQVNGTLCQNLINGVSLNIGSVSTFVNPHNASTTVYNYAERVYRHNPANYILQGMWDLTEPTYSASPLDMANEFHMDNQLPNIDSGLIKPLNILTFPIFKGTGYQMDYAPTDANVKFPNVQGWWSDNLQNRDDTLYAAQNFSNYFAVGSADLTQPAQGGPGWIDIMQLSGTNGLNAQALTNIYVCLFNRQRVITDPNNIIDFFMNNVVQNNVVPVDPTLVTNDPRYTDFDCDGTFQYTPLNISQYNNRLATDTSNDWLYFGTNLRAGAKEDVNILMSLNAVPGDTTYENYQTQVVGSSEFVYWNPANGPNSFLVVDDPVSVVKAQRSDIQLDVTVYPAEVNTFNAFAYALVHITDLNEINRTWTDLVNNQYYGFGDYAVSTYTGGGTNGAVNVLEPGQAGFATVTFINNAGFDWNLKISAITCNATTQYLQVNGNSANDPLVNIYQSANPIIAGITSYNFITPVIPAALQGYITIEPSTAYDGQAPIFFDFIINNAPVIRDGLTAAYFLNIFVSPNLPDAARGRVYDIPLTLNKEYFLQLPAYNDPIPNGIHNALPQIPPIRIAIPYSAKPASSLWANSTYYTSGYSSNLVWSHQIANTWKPVAAKKIDAFARQNLIDIAGSGQSVNASLFSWFNALPTTVPFQSSAVAGGYNNVVYQTSSVFSEFPIVTPPVQGPDVAETWIVLQLSAAQLSFGEALVSADLTVDYSDCYLQPKSTPYDTDIFVTVRGAFLQVSYIGQLFSNTTGAQLSFLSGPNTVGNIKIFVSVLNTGSAVANGVNITVILGRDITVATSSLLFDYKLTANTDGTTTLSLQTDEILVQNTNYTFEIDGAFTAITPVAGDPTNGRLFVKDVLATMFVTPDTNAQPVLLTQDTNTKYIVPYTLGTDAADGGLYATINLMSYDTLPNNNYNLHFNVTTNDAGNRYYVWYVSTKTGSRRSVQSTYAEKQWSNSIFFTYEAAASDAPISFVVDVTTTASQPSAGTVYTIDVESPVYVWTVPSSSAASAGSHANLLLLLLLLLLLPLLCLLLFCCYRRRRQQKGDGQYGDEAGFAAGGGLLGSSSGTHVDKTGGVITAGVVGARSAAFTSMANQSAAEQQAEIQRNEQLRQRQAAAAAAGQRSWADAFANRFTYFVRSQPLEATGAILSMEPKAGPKA